MEVYVQKGNRIVLVATKQPERNLLKHFNTKQPVISGFSLEKRNNKDTKVVPIIDFRERVKKP